MKKIILALACAVSVIVAKASDSEWFSGSASGTELTATNAVWSQLDSGVEVAEGVITLDLDTDELLTLTPDAKAAPDTETKTSVNVTANFYPNAFEDLEEPTGAQTALAVAYKSDESALSYYAWDGSDWVALSGATPYAEGATEVTAKIELDYYRSGKTKARFTIGGTFLKNADNVEWLPLTTDSRAVSSVEFAGSGKLKSVASTVELGVASVDGVKYPTLAEAVAAAEAAGVTSIAVVGQPLASDRVNGWTLNKTSSTYTKDQEVVVESDAETMLIAVPRDCTAAGLVDTSNRFEDDVLQVYNKTDRKYYTWTLNSENSEKEWVPAMTFAISGGETSAHSTSATDISLFAGQAAWLTRTCAESKNAPIKLLVAYSEDAVTVTLESGTAQSPKWNLVASPSSDPIVLSALAEKVGDADAILIPTDGGAPRNLRKSGGKLVYDGYKTVGDKKIPVEVEVENETIPVGTGFWYISGGTTRIEL